MTLENQAISEGPKTSMMKSKARQGAEIAEGDATSSAAQGVAVKKRRQPRKTALPVLQGLTSGESRKTRLSGATMAIIKSKTAAHGASPSDAVFMAAMIAMGRKKHQLPAVAKGEEVDLQLPPTIWSFLDGQVAATKSDLDTVIRAYLELG